MVFPAALLCGKWAKIRFLLQRRESVSHPRTPNCSAEVGIIARRLSLHLPCPLSLDCVGSSLHFGKMLIWSWRFQLSIRNDAKMEQNQNAWVRLPYFDQSVFCSHAGVTAFPGLTLPVGADFACLHVVNDKGSTLWEMITEKPESVTILRYYQ